MALVLEAKEAVQAGARSRLYALLAQGFRHPTSSLYEGARGGQLLGEAQEAVSQLPYELRLEGRLGSGLDWEREQMENQYIWLFDVGGPNPNSGEWEAPCFLYEGEYGGGRLKAMEDVLRFYHHFGLRLSQEEGKRDRPDHVATELEFLHALAYKEAELLEQGKGAEGASPYRRAARDFLWAHLGDLLGDVSGKVGPRGIPFYSKFAVLGDSFARRDLEYLREVGRDQA